MSSNGISLCINEQSGRIVEIINGAAEAYKGVIPSECWHEPYMSRADLDREVSAGVIFWGYNIGSQLVGVMGIQSVCDVKLIRHAYVSPECQGRGIGSHLLRHIRSHKAGERTLVGTWAAADWAVRFYERHGFQLASQQVTEKLLRAYWKISERQMKASVVLRTAAMATSGEAV